MGIISKNIENLKPNKEYIVTVRAKNNDVNILSSYTDSVRFQTPTDSTVPSAPTNLVLAASFFNVLFKYTDSVDEDAGKYEYELYKQAQIQIVSGLNSIISGQTPHRTGFVQTNVFVVSVDDNSTTTSTSSTTNPVKYYGRIRTIDTSGNVSGWTSIVASGDTPLIDEDFIGSLTAGKITAGTIGAHEIILTQPGTATTITSPDNKAILRSSNYNGTYNNATDIWTSGSAGWIISGDGRAEFNNIVARGAIDGGTIDIGASGATSFHVDSSGNMWLGASTFSASPPFKVTSAGALTATGVNVTGAITATSGTFTGTLNATSGTFNNTITVGTNDTKINIVGTSATTTTAIYSSGTGYGYGTGSGFWMDASGRFSLGTNLTWNGSTLSINGGGTFTGALSGGTISIGTGNNIFKADSNGIYLGHGTTFLSAPFRVTPAGEMTATAGNIGNWTIGEATSGASSFPGSIYKQTTLNGVTTLSLMSPQGFAWFSAGVVTPSISGFTTGVSTNGGALNTMIIRNIQYGGTKPGSPAVGDIYFS